MHRPTYLVIMGMAAISGICNAVKLYQTNGFLFAISILVTLITGVGAFLQFMDVDAIEFKWMLGYTLPVAMLAVGGVVGYAELGNAALVQAGVTPPPPVIQGKSSDYMHAATMQWVAMVYPLCAVAFAKLVQVLIDWFNKP